VRTTIDSIASSPKGPLWQSSSQPPTPLSNDVSYKISALQAELKLIRDNTIPIINTSIQYLSKELEATKVKLGHFDSRFDQNEYKQEVNATAFSSRLNKWDLVPEK
jgi:hypothetical protein